MGRSTQDPVATIEPARDETDPVSQRAVSPACLNCGNPVPERFCGECGQKLTGRRLRTGELVRDYLGDLFNFESRLWLTMRTLLFDPGLLTCEYLAGRRVRYSPPFRLLLVSGLAFGLVWAMTRSTDATYYGSTPGSNSAGVYSKVVLQSAFLTCFLLSLWLKLFYLKSSRTLAEHALFTLHAAAFGLVWSTGMVLLGTAYKLFWGIMEDAPYSLALFYFASMVVFVVYLFFSLRTVYPERAWVLRLKFLGITALSAITMFSFLTLISMLYEFFTL